MFYYLGMAFESEASCPDFGSIQMYFVGTRAQGYMEYGDIKFRKYTLLEEDLNKLNLINNAIAGSIAYALDTGNIYKLQGGSGGWQLSGNESGKNMGFDVAVVEQLPETGEKGIIYLVPHSHGESDSYDEYIWATIKYEKIGNTDIDLSGYVQKLATAASGQIPKIKSDGGLEASGFTLGKSVPADAVFTDTTYSNATQNADGLMSKEDKTKLDGITIANYIPKVTDETGEVPKFKADGTLESTGFTLGKSVPSDAVFTDTTYAEATTETAGLMSSADKVKLNNLDGTNYIPKVTNKTGEVPKFNANGYIESTGFTLGKSVPADAVFTDVNTTYTLTQDSNDGHKITFASSDSNVSDTVITIPDNNTTYTLTQDANDGHKITFTPSTGNATTITIPDNDTTYNAATQQAAGLMSSADKTKLDSITVANLLTTADIVVCTQDEYDQLDPKPALLYFIREDEGGT